MFKVGIIEVTFKLTRMGNENCIWYLVLSTKYNSKFKSQNCKSKDKNHKLNLKTQMANVKTTWQMLKLFKA